MSALADLLLPRLMAAVLGLGSVLPGGFLATSPPTPSTAVWPLDPMPVVVAGFDPPLTPYAAGHRGVDLAGAVGQEVRAALAGRVTFAGSLAGRGVVVVVHGATRTTYEPVRAAVSVGDPVHAGQVVGTLQGHGSHCAPRTCLHWGLLDGETYLDPLSLVGAGPVRLLPLLDVEGFRHAATRTSPGAGPGWRLSPPVVRAPHVADIDGATTGWSPPLPRVRHVGVPGGMPGAAGLW